MNEYADPTPGHNADYTAGWYGGRSAAGLSPGEVVAVPSELPDPENWEVYDQGFDEWKPACRITPWLHRMICRPINKEAGE